MTAATYLRSIFDKLLGALSVVDDLAVDFSVKAFQGKERVIAVLHFA
jgi:hypothetical protein